MSRCCGQGGPQRRPDLDGRAAGIGTVATKAPLPAAENPGLAVTTQRDHRGPSPLTGPFGTPDRERKQTASQAT